jgi:hypothetical protein
MNYIEYMFLKIFYGIYLILFGSMQFKLQLLSINTQKFI